MIGSRCILSMSTLLTVAHHRQTTISLTCRNFSDISRIIVKFPDISMFSRWVATLNSTAWRKDHNTVSEQLAHRHYVTVKPPGVEPNKPLDHNSYTLNFTLLYHTGRY